MLQKQNAVRGVKLFFLICISFSLIMCATAFEGFSIDVSANNTDANACFFVLFMNSDGEPIIEEETSGLSKSIGVEELSGEAPFMLDIQLVSYDIENYTLTGFEINGDIVTDPQSYYIEDYEIYDFLYEDLETDNLEDVSIKAIFSPKGISSSYTPKVSIAANDLSKGTIASLDPMGENETGSEWKLTIQPSDGYQLAYIQDVDDITNRVYSSDGTTIRWTINKNTEYTAHFEEATMHFESGSFSYAPLRYSAGWEIQLSPKPIAVGQRVGFHFSYSLPSKIPANSTYHFTLYAGTDTSASPLASYSRTQTVSLSGSGKHMTLAVDPLPAELEEVTVALQIDEGAIVTETFPVTVQPSSELDLRFFSVPSGMTGIYPSDGRTAIGGPTVYDAAAFTDEKTGALSLYLAVSGGVMKMDGASSLSYMDGMLFGYNDQETSAGYPFAIDGADREHLAALVKATNGDYNSGLYTTYCIYECVNDSWSMVEGSALEEEYTAGLVMNRDDIWVSDQHWNGTAWSTSGYDFNSFWKESNSSAYAGSANGLYHYDGAAWTQVSGVSGTVRIDSAARSDGKVTIISAASSVIEVTNDTATVSAISGKDGIVSGNQDSSFLYIGVDENEDLFGIVQGRLYQNEGTAGYTGSYIYKQTAGSWVNQIVEEFNDPNEDGDMDSKLRADGVAKILNPCENVSLFVGYAGAIYGEFGDSTITFETNGGTSVAPIKRAINSAVTAPVSPTRDGYTFVGWFTLDSFLQNGASFAWGLMPAKDITLYAKWVETGSGGDVFATERSNAENSLNTAYQRLTESEYSAEIWAQIVAAYETGLSGIRAAATYDGIYAALNTAIDEINALSQNTNQTITVAVTVEKLTVDGKYIIEPTLVEVKKYTQASVVLTDLLNEKYADTYEGTPYRITGTVSNSFYLAGIYDPAYVPATSGNNGKNAEGEYFDQTYEDFLSEFDGGRWAGWMYCVNGKFPGVGASGWTLLDGEVMRWQYSCTGLGCDIGADNSEWGATNSTEVADKDALIWKVAEINRDGKQSDFGEAYTNAMTVLKTIEASQDAVNAALAALNNGSGSEPSVTAENGEGGGSVTVGSKTLSVVSNGAAVTAAVGEGDIVTITAANDAATITLTGAAAYTGESNTFTATSTGDVPCVILAKKADGSYERRTVTTENGVHTVTLAADEEIVVAVKGDTDGNGRITAGDWGAVITRFKSNSFEGLPAWAYLLYDVDGNGSLSAGDWGGMISAFKGITPLPW